MEFTLEDLTNIGARMYLSVYKKFDEAEVNAEDEDKFLQLLEKGLNTFDFEYAQKVKSRYLFDRKEPYLQFLAEEHSELLLALPRMLYSPKALDQLEKNNDLVRLFALMLVKIHKLVEIRKGTLSAENVLPIEIELRIIHFPGNGNLVQAFVDVGYKWSERAKRQLERFWPEMYAKLSKGEARSYNSWLNL